MMQTCVPTMWADDTAVLHAVDALLRDEDLRTLLECGFGSFPQPITTREKISTPFNTTTDRTSGSLQGPRMINPSRMRRRHEILTLREQEKLLKRQLHAIQEARTGTSAVADPVERNVLKRAWQQVAETQREQRTAVEATRFQLHSTAAHQLRSIRQIQRLLQRHTTALRPLLKSRPVKPVSRESSPRSVGEMFVPLWQMCSERQDLWHESRLLKPMGELRDVRVDTTTPERLRVEAVSSRVLPFDIPVATDAVMRYYEASLAEVVVTEQDRRPASAHATAHDLVVFLDMPHYKGYAYGQIDTQHFVEPDGRAVILRCCVFDRIERLDGQPVDGFGLRYSMRTVIGPPRNDQLRGHARALTQIDNFDVSEPILPFESPEHILQQLQTFCTASAQFVLDKERQSVENLLLDVARSTACVR